MISYDLLIIGSGPAGQRAAIYANKLGKRAAVVERMRTVGGVSVNTGTIPSKTMREAVMHLSGYNYQCHLRHELPGEGKDHDGGSCLPRPARDQDRDRRDARRSFRAMASRYCSGIASFEDATTLRVTNEGGTQTYQAENIVIATGTKPADSPKVPSTGVPSSTVIRFSICRRFPRR